VIPSGHLVPQKKTSSGLLYTASIRSSGINDYEKESSQSVMLDNLNALDFFL
jgi:hypothetical protein